jgi:fatty-acyl-CoA synthase
MASAAVNYTPLTPLSFLTRSAAVYPEKTAVVYRHQRYTYRQFRQRVNRLATALQGVGVTTGERVAFLCPNTPPMLEAHYGVPLAGGILVAINIRLSAPEIAYILNHSGAKVLCVDSEFADLIQPIQDQLTHLETVVRIVDSPTAEALHGLEYEAFLASGSDVLLDKPVVDENEPISINYTSGTTGNPKGVMYTHRSAYLNALGEALEMGLNNRSTYLWTLPMFHCNGWCFTWGVTAVGATHVCLRRVDPDEVFRLIETENVSHFCGAPTVLISLTSHPRAKTAVFPRQLHVTTAGAPPSPTVIANMEALGAEIFHVYGLTETYGPHSICAWHAEWDDLPADERARKKARQGVPYIVAEEMRVVDDDMQDVPADATTMGEVIMRGNNVMRGYYEQPEATATAFRGGWFHSGDLAVMHPDGYIELRDRQKDIIISGGENISTIEVENTIYRHPAVQEVAVIAIPDEKWGEVPKAFVVPKPGTNPTAEEIIQFCRERIAHFKCPKAVEFGDLPKTSTGKIKKFELREQEWQGYEKRIH